MLYYHESTKFEKHEKWKNTRIKTAVSHPFAPLTRGTENTEKSNASLKIAVGLVKR
jgi:hypothetical protein